MTLAGAIAERPGGISRQVTVLGGGVQANAPGFDALTERGRGFAGVPEQHPQVPFRHGVGRDRSPGATARTTPRA